MERTALPGTPMTSWPASIRLPSATSAAAATMQSSPSAALLRTVACMPTSTRSPIVAPCTMALWPSVQSAPMVQGAPSSAWMEQLSCTLVRAPMEIGAASPRMTAPNQTLARDSMVTSPVTTAVGAMKASGAIRGQTPRYGRMGIGIPLQIESYVGTRQGHTCRAPHPYQSHARAPVIPQRAQNAPDRDMSGGDIGLIRRHHTEDAGAAGSGEQAGVVEGIVERACLVCHLGSCRQPRHEVVGALLRGQHLAQPGRAGKRSTTQQRQKCDHVRRACHVVAVRRAGFKIHKAARQTRMAQFQLIQGMIDLADTDQPHQKVGGGIVAERQHQKAEIIEGQPH